MITLDQARALGGAWFGSYLDADWQPRTEEASQAVLESVGLTGPFWQLETDGDTLYPSKFTQYQSF